MALRDGALTETGSNFANSSRCVYYVCSDKPGVFLVSGNRNNLRARYESVSGGFTINYQVFSAYYIMTSPSTNSQHSSILKQ